MNLLIDSNVVLDVLQMRYPHYHFSNLVWQLCGKGHVDGYVSALTFTNITYIMRKELDKEKIILMLYRLSRVFKFTDLCVSDIANAAKLSWSDFEDAVQAATAERMKADFIVTRNAKDFSASPIKAITPEDFILTVLNL